MDDSKKFYTISVNSDIMKFIAPWLSINESNLSSITIFLAYSYRYKYK